MSRIRVFACAGPWIRSPSRILPLLLIFGLLFPPAAARAFDVAAVVGSGAEEYEEALASYLSFCAEGVRSSHQKALGTAAVRVYRVNGPSAALGLGRSLHSERPDVILAIGEDALRVAETGPRVPLVYLMASPDEAKRRRFRATGVELQLPADVWLTSVLEALPHVRRIGAVYNPDVSGAMVGETVAEANRRGVDFLAVPARSARSVGRELGTLRGRVDALWMAPDLSLLTPETVEQLLVFSMEQAVPVIAFSRRYLERGAALSVELDFAALGRQAAQMTFRLLTGASLEEVPPEPPRQARAELNRKILGKMGLAAAGTRTLPLGSP